jgi:hypothetical protein
MYVNSLVDKKGRISALFILLCLKTNAMPPALLLALYPILLAVP